MKWVFDSHVQSSSVKFHVRHPMVKNCNKMLAGNILSWNWESSLYALTMSPLASKGVFVQAILIQGKRKCQIEGNKIVREEGNK